MSYFSAAVGLNKGKVVDFSAVLESKKKKRNAFVSKSSKRKYIPKALFVILSTTIKRNLVPHFVNKLCDSFSNIFYK